MSAWRDPSSMQPNSSMKGDGLSVEHRHSNQLQSEHNVNSTADNNNVHTPAPSSSPSNSDADKSNAANMECVVCGDKSSGKHYGQYTCEGCKSFFKRSVRRNLSYQCRGTKNCPIDQHHRNQCQYCRLKKCQKSGMRREAVQRGRVSTQPLLPGQYPFVGGNFMNGHSFADGYIGALMRAEAMYSGPRYASAAHCFPAAASNYIGGVENVTEIASRLLFSSVGWCRGIPFFNDLNANDQWCLVKNSWTDLFILSAAQSGAQLISPQVLAAANLQSHYSGTERLQQVYNSCTAFQDRVEKLKALHLDAAEYSCLKAIVLYSADAPQLTDPLTIDNLQEKSQLALEEYTRSHSQYSNQPNRTGRILLRLPGLKAVTGSFLEQLFFSRLLSSKTCTFEILLREIFFGTGGTSNAFNSWPYPVQPALPPCQ